MQRVHHPHDHEDQHRADHQGTRGEQPECEQGVGAAALRQEQQAKDRETERDRTPLPQDSAPSSWKREMPRTTSSEPPVTRLAPGNALARQDVRSQ
ncbi:hypothetical protein [Nocardiopsis metallicus]|uniref:Uncharacterized protein n=1 Tax=Nocardiopsis metallicus TaxID=179819 RepID=A0A840W7I2_9ACTN|nr:hypothetical protein [Nocardiopsis metallicus]MBB5492969.1 hypothetical protein [Nocardiopsis metallicus]